MRNSLVVVGNKVSTNLYLKVSFICRDERGKLVLYKLLYVL